MEGLYLHLVTASLDSTKWSSGVMTVLASTGAHVWNKLLYSTYTSYISSDQVVSDGTYLYGVIGQTESGPTIAGYEYIIPKFVASTGTLST